MKLNREIPKSTFAIINHLPIHVGLPKPDAPSVSIVVTVKYIDWLKLFIPPESKMKSPSNLFITTNNTNIIEVVSTKFLNL